MGRDGAPRERRGARRARRRHWPDDPAELPWFRLPAPPDPAGADPVLVVGAGLGGCALVRALARRGRRSLLIDRGADLARGASGNPAAVVKPFVSRAPSAAEAFHLEAFTALERGLGEDELHRRAGFAACGALQLTERPYPARAPYRVVDVAEAAGLAGTRLPSGGLFFERAGRLDPAALCRALADASLVERAVSAEIHEPVRDADGGWEVRARDGRRWRAPTLVLATGADLAATPWTRELPIVPARGQISRFRTGGDAPRCVVTGRHYVIPDGDTLLVGATFGRGDTDPAVRAADHAANRDGLAALLPGLAFDPAPLAGYAGVRATTPDRLPLVGPVPDLAACRRVYADLGDGRPATRYPPLPTVAGLAALGGFGSRGAVTALFCAELVADWLVGGDTLQGWMPLLSSARFAVRDLRRSSPARAP